MAGTARKSTRRPLYEHIETGTVWRVVKEKPFTLEEALVGRSQRRETRRPSKVTLGRDYRLMEAS